MASTEPANSGTERAGASGAGGGVGSGDSGGDAAEGGGAPRGGARWVLTGVARLVGAGVLPTGERVEAIVKPSRWMWVMARPWALASASATWAAAWRLSGTAAEWWPLPGLSNGALSAAWVDAWLWAAEWGALAGVVGVVSINAMDRATRVYALTDRRVLSLVGIVRQRLAEIPLRRVQSLGVRRTARERVTGTGSVGVSSAGSAGLEVVWVMVARPSQELSRLRSAVERAGPGTSVRGEAGENRGVA